MSWLASLPVAGLVPAIVWWVRRRFLVVTVSGPSMAPTFQDGDRLLAVRRPGRRLRTGQVVVADLGTAPAPGGAPAAAMVELRGRSRVIKRVAAMPGEPVPPGVDRAATVPPGMLVLLGDNAPDSVDSRHYGYVPTGQVIGVVLRRMR